MVGHLIRGLGAAVRVGPAKVGIPAYACLVSTRVQRRAGPLLSVLLSISGLAGGTPGRVGPTRGVARGAFSPTVMSSGRVGRCPLAAASLD
jgi:hypothetical protein